MKKTFIVLFLLTLLFSPAFAQVDPPLLWVYDLIAQFKKAPAATPPASILRCDYQAEKIYYVPAQGEDAPSVLYSEEGERLCSPDETDDTYCSKFNDEKMNCETIWQDDRAAAPEPAGGQ